LVINNYKNILLYYEIKKFTIDKKEFIEEIKNYSWTINYYFLQQLALIFILIY